MGFGKGLIATFVAALVALALPALAAAAPPAAGEYQEDDYAEGNSFNIVPPGQNGLTTALDLTQFLLDGTRPPHQADQNDMYANLVYATPGLEPDQILDFYKDASFGVQPAQVERNYTPTCLVITPPSPNSGDCDDVRIVRDQFGIPHVYGQDRAALMFGLGYVTGEDRLFLADALRHAGRGDLSSFAGGANVGQDRDTFANAPYMNEAELQAQYDQADEIYGQDGIQIQKDVQNYVDGMNQWIAEARLDVVNKFDALYVATLHPEGPQPWKVTDVIATGALVAGIFGKGGGGEVGAATALQKAREVLGAQARHQRSGATSAPRTTPSRRPRCAASGSRTGCRAAGAASRCRTADRSRPSRSSRARARRSRRRAPAPSRSSRASTRSRRGRTRWSSPLASPRPATRSRCSARRRATTRRSC